MQGYKGKQDFASRMFTYFYRIRDRYNNRIQSIAIFTDSNKRFHPTEYRYQEGETSIVFKFRTYKIIEQDQKLLEQSDNPFAIVILTVQLALRKKKLQNDYFNLTMNLVRWLYQKGFERKKIVQLLRFIKLYVSFDEPDINAKFDTEVNTLENKTKTMGIIEQEMQIRKEEGMLEKNIAIIKKLLAKGDYSVEEIAEIAEVSIDFVLKIMKELKMK